MNKIAETFWIASAVVIGTALVVVAVPLLAIVVFFSRALSPPRSSALLESATAGMPFHPSRRRDLTSANAFPSLSKRPTPFSKGRQRAEPIGVEGLNDVTAAANAVRKILRGRVVITAYSAASQRV